MTIKTTKKINVLQLCQEANASINSTSDGTTTVLTGNNITDEALQPFVDAHIAQDWMSNRDTLTTQASSALQTNRDYLAISAPTNAQVVAQVKALTRQNIGIIRLLINALDGTN